MSRAFVKDDAPDGPVLIPPRAPLPPGTPNYVTPTGMARLRAERLELEAERSAIQSRHRDDPDRARQLAVLAGRLAELTARIESAREVDPATQPADEVRFGATVRIRTVDGGRAGLVRDFTLVGVDESDPSSGRIGFTAPIARAVTGRRVGDTVEFTGPGGTERLVVDAVTYRTPPDRRV